MSSVVRIWIAVGACALLASACGGDPVVDRCLERFNSASNQMRSGFVEESAPVWLGESKARPEKCIAVVGLGNQGFIVMRENFNPGAESGEWTGLSNVSESEGSSRALGARINDPNAVGKADGTIKAK